MEQNQKNISISVIKRLPRYYRYLSELLNHDINRISSKELSEQMGITASQIRQDLNNFGCFGKQGYGYDVESLCNEIAKILGLEKVYDLIIIGAGNLGHALVNYTNFKNRGYRFIGIFECNKELIGTEMEGIEIMDISSLQEFASNNSVDIAALCVPAKAAEDIAKLIEKCGITGIWNFTNVDITTACDMPNSVIVENVYLTDSLMTLTYKINESKIIENLNI